MASTLRALSAGGRTRGLCRGRRRRARLLATARDDAGAGAGGAGSDDAASAAREAARSAGSGAQQARKADSTDAISTWLTRRFGLAGGLAWTGFLLFGVVSEQLKTRNEVRVATTGMKEVTDAPLVKLPSGTEYRDEVVGAGDAIYDGAFVLIDYTATTADGVVIEDTGARGRKAKAFLYSPRGSSFGTVAAGLQQALAGSRVGQRRRVHVPASAAWGDGGTLVELPGDGSLYKLPGGVDVEYVVTLQRVSVPPS